MTRNFALPLLLAAGMASVSAAPSVTETPARTAVPINAAEAVLEPFWDPQLSGLGEWRIADGALFGLKVTQGWSWVDVAWARRPAAGPVLKLSRRLDLDCSAYDALMVCMNPGRGNALRLSAQTDAGERAVDVTGYPDERKEYFLRLDGAHRLNEVSLAITPSQDGPGAAWIQWVGLQSSARLAAVRDRFEHCDPDWPRHLQAPGFVPRFEPTYGIAITADELRGLRESYRVLRQAQGETVFEAAAEHARKRAPETMISDFVSYINSRTSRDRDAQRWLLQTGVNAAVAGLVLEDAELLRLGARYALSIAACTYWDDGFTSYFPLSAWEQRPFIQALATHDVAMLLDLTGEALTDTGRDLLRRRLAEHGLGAINYAYWKHDYIYDCNQAAWFSPGRLLAYGVLERDWPRTRPYADLAHADLLSSIDRILRPDGSYAEGPMYFNPVGRDAALALYYHSRVRKRDFLQALPDRMRRSADFAELVLTSTGEGDYIPYGDSYSRDFPPLVKAAMAGAMPESAWGEMLRRTLSRAGADPALWPLRDPFRPNYLTSLSDVVIAWRLARQARSGTFTPRAFVRLPESGMMASFRHMGAQPLKLLLIGNRAQATHNHEDKGSFVLELAGETFVTDPIRALSYGDPAIALGKQAQSHNLLLPVGTLDRPAQLNPLPVDVAPQGQGDARSFHATMDLTPGWPGFYRRWTRTWDSPTPERLTLRDDYELAQGTGVEFVLWTERDVAVEGRTVRFTGKAAEVRFSAPADCALRVDEVPGPRAGYRRPRFSDSMAAAR